MENKSNSNVVSIKPANDNGGIMENYLKVTEGRGKRVCERFVPGFQPQPNVRYITEKREIAGKIALVYEFAEPVVVENRVAQGARKGAKRGRAPTGQLEKIAAMLIAGKNLTIENIVKVLKVKKGTATCLMAGFRKRYGKSAVKRVGVYYINPEMKDNVAAIQAVYIAYNQHRDDARLKKELAVFKK